MKKYFYKLLLYFNSDKNDKNEKCINSILSFFKI